MIVQARRNVSIRYASGICRQFRAELGSSETAIAMSTSSPTRVGRRRRYVFGHDPGRAGEGLGGPGRGEICPSPSGDTSSDSSSTALPHASEPQCSTREVYAFRPATAPRPSSTRWAVNEVCEGTPLNLMWLSFAVSVTLVELAIVRMCVARPRDLSTFYNNLLADIRRQVIPPRPGRSCPRR